MEDNKEITTNIDNLTVTNACLYENKKSITKCCHHIFLWCCCRTEFLYIMDF